MKKEPQPWLRRGRGWYVQLGKAQISLGPDEKEAHQRYHALMAKRPKEVKAAEAPKPSDPSTLEVCDRFVTYCRNNRAEATAFWYHKYLKSFLDFLGARQHFPAADLCPNDVTEWTDAHAWSATTRRGAMIAVQRAVSWTAKQRRWANNPLADLEKPAATRRENVVTPSDFATIMKNVHYQEAIDLLTVAWEVGCRPQEIIRVEKRHWQEDRWVFPADESKGKKKARVVYLTPKAIAVCRRLAKAHPHGRLFRTSSGTPWHPHSVNCLMNRVSKKIGRKFALYDFRHGVATRLLKAGVDTISVATLLGHVNGDMLSRHYSHVHADADHLKKALRKRA